MNDMYVKKAWPLLLFLVMRQGFDPSIEVINVLGSHFACVMCISQFVFRFFS